jgi:hypothetical protein
MILMEKTPLLSDNDYQALKDTIKPLIDKAGKELTFGALKLLVAELSENKQAVMGEFLTRYQQEDAGEAKTLADAILGPETKQEYNTCLAHIKDCYNRMASNRDADYRAKQMQLAEKMLERMTELLELAANQEREGE